MSPTSSSTLRVADAYSNGQEGSASDEWCEQAALLANYFHDLAVSAISGGTEDGTYGPDNDTYDKYMAVSDDIANQAEDAGCVVVY